METLLFLALLVGAFMMLVWMDRKKRRAIYRYWRIAQRHHDPYDPLITTPFLTEPESSATVSQPGRWVHNASTSPRKELPLISTVDLALLMGVVISLVFLTKIATWFPELIFALAKKRILAQADRLMQEVDLTKNFISVSQLIAWRPARVPPRARDPPTLFSSVL